LLIRYTTSKKGKPVKQAEIYTQKDHNIDTFLIDRDARWVCSILSKSGHKAYIVGGAVRDLLIGKSPKDFDIVTDASPRKVKKIIRNSRIIGKRFRLVHVFFRTGKILEVATFRALESEAGNAVYGPIEEDVQRRDFTINALYYDPLDQRIYDYVGGYKHIRQKKIYSIIPLKKSFQEDPVRMVRAVKYSASTGSRLTFFLKRQIKKDAGLICSCSLSRMTEELFKIFLSGFSAPIMKELNSLGLLEGILPAFCEEGRQTGVLDEFFQQLEFLDKKREDQIDELTRGQILYYVLEPFMISKGFFNEARPEYRDGINMMKELLKPLVSANKDIEKALTLMFKRRNLTVPRKRVRPVRPRKKHISPHAREKKA